jgi:oligopeptide/dipeptide ABC transporter ATP-binding protein
LYHNPLHPYTRALMLAIPHVDPKLRGKRKAFGGEVPSPINQPQGCPFNPRCPLADNTCLERRAELVEAEGKQGHLVACLKAGVK